MPVATQGTVKGVSPDELRELGSQIVLSNTYHLHLRPGEKQIAELGGIQKFMGWDGPILTDSGGYQVFSLAKLRKVEEQGVTFQSHHDGAKVFLNPEKVVEIQETLGVDIQMVLDECLPADSSKSVVERSLAMTQRWALRAQAARQDTNVLAFGIGQGGMFADLRKKAIQELREIPFDGYAIGGLSVGEECEVMREMTAVCTKELPKDKPRYLMGVGTPLDLVESVALGVDMFDCVMPTRSARFGRIFADFGYFNIRNKRFRSDANPLEEGCDCYTCERFSRAYIAHLIHADEMLGLRLASLHNLRFYQRLMQRIRRAILSGTYSSFVKEFASDWHESMRERT
ncbi:UNVERIFIED_CONTAM: hypothetical protein GTU68_027240 [Idotea baltica]|nr:hypothetical protein [Idotea baltica]